MFNFESQVIDKEYTIQIKTDELAEYKKIMEKCEEIMAGTTTINPQPSLGKNYVNTIPTVCKSCPNHPSNGGSGICHCTLPYSTNAYPDSYLKNTYTTGQTTSNTFLKNSKIKE